MCTSGREGGHVQEQHKWQSCVQERQDCVHGAAGREGSVVQEQHEWQICVQERES